jgi:small membrane protein
MIFQFLLTVALIGIMLYGISQRMRSLPVSAVTVLASVVALYFAWAPNHATAIAAWVGVGRGADLIFYCWVLISLILILNLHLRLRSHVEMITELSRHIALAEARQHRDPQDSQIASRSPPP